jgi:hypothetical protein
VARADRRLGKERAFSSSVLHSAGLLVSGHPSTATAGGMKYSYFEWSAVRRWFFSNTSRVTERQLAELERHLATDLPTAFTAIDRVAKPRLGTMLQPLPLKFDFTNPLEPSSSPREIRDGRQRSPLIHTLQSPRGGWAKARLPSDLQVGSAAACPLDPTAHAVPGQAQPLVERSVDAADATQRRQEYRG